ncbi:MAG: PhnE/PtxC family ABC transporter permease [Planctomycetota bacterium]
MPDLAVSSGWSLTRRARILSIIAALGLLAYFGLGLRLGDLLPEGNGADLVKDFLAAAFRPAFTYETTGFLPENAPPFLLKVAMGLWNTLVYAIAAISLAFVAGLGLGVLASASFWKARPAAFGMVRWPLRFLLTAMRSVHELLWALILLAALGLNPAAAVLAILIPYAGTLGKVFSEMLDENDGRPADALDQIGAAPLQVFLFGRLPRALPDIAAYTFYRFECAVRSSAVLGFFGFTTVGLYLKQSFENLHYREVWTYLYGLILVVLLLEAWSAQLRRRFVV